MNFRYSPDPYDYRTPLHIAAQYNNYRFIQTVSKFFETDFNAQDCHGYTALHIAAQHGHEQCLTALLANGRKVKLDFEGYDQVSPLHVAIANDHVGTVRMLLQSGANEHCF